MRKPSLIFAALLASLALIAAGCGGSDNNNGGSGGSSGSSGAQGNGADTTESSSGGGGGGGATKLKLVADPGGALKFDKTALSAKPGKVTIVMDNQSPVPHAVDVEGNGVEKGTKTVTKGTASVTVDLKAGKYDFYCPVDGHRAAGMEGTLTVG
jgi:plastocyanin